MKKKIILGLLAFVMMFTFTTFNSQEAAATKKKIAYVSVKSTYMYKKADRKTKIMSLKKQTAVTYYSMTKPMVKVKYKGKIGYIPAKNLIFLATESQYTTYDREGKRISKTFEYVIQAEKVNNRERIVNSLDTLIYNIEIYRKHINESTLKQKQKQQLEKKHIHPYLKEITRMEKYLQALKYLYSFNNNYKTDFSKTKRDLLKSKSVLKETREYIKKNGLRPIPSKNLEKFERTYNNYYEMYINS